MAERTGRFRRSDRLLSSRDFRRVSRQGRRAGSREFVVLMAPRAGIRNSPGKRGAAIASRRLGITTSRKVGNAVVRNRIRRAVREWYRKHRTALAEGVDIVVIAKPAAADLRFEEIVATLDRLAESL